MASSRLFRSDTLTYGQLDIDLIYAETNMTTPFQSFLFVLNDISIVLPDYTRVTNPEEGYMTVKESQKISDKAKTMKFGFFFDGSELLNEIDRKRNYIFGRILSQLALVMCVMTIISGIILYVAASRIARKLTSKIIKLLEMLE